MIFLRSYPLKRPEVRGSYEKPSSQQKSGSPEVSGKISYKGVSKNSGTPKSSILIGFSIIYHPFWGTPIFGSTHNVSGILGGGDSLTKSPPFFNQIGPADVPKKMLWTARKVVMNFAQ